MDLEPTKQTNNKYKLEVELTVEKVEKIKKNLLLSKSSLEKLTELSNKTGESVSNLIDRAIQAMKVIRS